MWPVFCVQANQRPVVRCLHHGFEDRVVFHHHGAAVGHEHLEAGDTLPDHLVHLGQTVVRQVLDDHVEAIVDGSLAFGLLVPYLQRLGQSLASLLHDKVDNAGGAPHRRGDGAGAEVVGGDGAAKGKVQVRMRINTARYDVFAGGIDDLFGVGRQVGPDGAYLSVVDQKCRLRSCPPR